MRYVLSQARPGDVRMSSADDRQLQQARCLCVGHEKLCVQTSLPGLNQSSARRLQFAISREHRVLQRSGRTCSWVEFPDLGRVANPRPVATIKTGRVAQPTTDAF